jgi:hypothetical protein
VRNATRRFLLERGEDRSRARRKGRRKHGFTVCCGVAYAPLKRKTWKDGLRRSHNVRFDPPINALKIRETDKASLMSAASVHEGRGESSHYFFLLILSLEV